MTQYEDFPPNLTPEERERQEQMRKFNEGETQAAPPEEQQEAQEQSLIDQQEAYDKLSDEEKAALEQQHEEVMEGDRSGDAPPPEDAG